MQRPVRTESKGGGAASTVAKAAGRVVPEANKKPVRSKPMRGPGAEDTAATRHDGLRASQQQHSPQHQQQQQHPAALAQANMKEEFCTQMLMGGYVQSFIDLFYLTHRSESASSTDAHAAKGSSSGINSSTVFDIAEMEFLRDQLVTAEHCKRKGDIPDVLGAYDNLAAYCQEKGDVKTMIFFFDKCLEIARLVNDAACELRVLSKLGAGYHALGDLDKARECHETHVRIAAVVYANKDDDELRSDAYRQLGRVLVDVATQRERAQEFAVAIDCYKQLLDCASKAGDADGVLHAQFKVGACYNALAQPANALPFLESYLTTCRTTGDVEGEGNACAALATAHEQLNHKQVSIDFLNQYIAIATRAENVVNQADACRRLGFIYTASQDFGRAREMHEKHYELVPAVVAQTHDATQLNCARIDVGAARANDKLAVLLTLVQSDVRGLLEWKNARTLPSVE